MCSDLRRTGFPGAAGRSGSYRGSVTAAQALKQLQETHDSDQNNGSGNSAAECESLRAALDSARQELLDVYEQVTLPCQKVVCHAITKVPSDFFNWAWLRS